MTTASRNPIPTLQDVARRAGVSTATVSRCLNTPDRVIENTRERVLSAVAELGYAPNFSARALAAKRTNTIGAVIPTMENAIFARGLQAFQDVLNARNTTLLVASSQYDGTVEAQQIRNLIARGVDAMFLIGHHRAGEIYRLLEDCKIPAVVAWAYDPGAHVPTVGFDNRAAMAALASEVIARGHRTLGYISAERTQNDRARARVKGVLDAMKKSGLDPDTLQIVETTYSIANGATAARRLLERAARPTALICGNDVLAVGAIRAVQQAGLRVPQDISVTGFDDIELSQVTTPPLTTVHVPHREMGRRAAGLLLAMLADEHPKPLVELETSIVFRGTLAERA